MDATISDGEITDKGESSDDVEVKSEDSKEKYDPDEYLDGSNVDTEDISESDFDIEVSDGSSERTFGRYREHEQQEGHHQYVKQ